MNRQKETLMFHEGTKSGTTTRTTGAIKDQPTGEGVAQQGSKERLTYILILLLLVCLQSSDFKINTIKYWLSIKAF